MEFRVFRKPEASPPDDSRPKPFGKRPAGKAARTRRLTRSGVAKALLLGLGLGVLGMLVAPSL